MIRTVVADDHDVVRKGVLYLLSQEADIEVAGEASDGREAVRLVESLKPHVLIMDIAMPQLNGIDAAAQLAAAAPGTAIILLSMYSEEEFMIRALNAGVRGYLLKDAPSEQLASALRQVMRGVRVIDPQLAVAAWGEEDPLTERERAVLRLAGEGATSAQIAERLHLSQGTVRNYLSEAIGKLGAANRIEAFRTARQKGWL